MADMTQPAHDTVTVALLTGGRGTRLAPLTTVFPKPLVPLGDKPVLEILLRQLARHRFGDVILSTGYLSELLMAVVGDGRKYGVDVSYKHEETPLGTAGPLALLRDRLSDPFLVMNGDLLTTLSFTELLAYHVREKNDATVAVFPREVKVDFGLIESDAAGQFTGYREKPVYKFEVSMGVYAMSRSVLRYVPDGERLDMPDLVAQVHAGGGRVGCYRENCYWLDIGRMDDYATAQDQFQRNAAMFLGPDT
jgi:NDP-sugar pyrophosphorylase family protein